MLDNKPCRGPTCILSGAFIALIVAALASAIRRLFWALSRTTYLSDQRRNNTPAEGGVTGGWGLVGVTGARRVHPAEVVRVGRPVMRWHQVPAAHSRRDTRRHARIWTEV